MLAVSLALLLQLPCQPTLVSPSTAGDPTFGESISVDGDTMLVAGLPQAPLAPIPSALLYERNVSTGRWDISPSSPLQVGGGGPVALDGDLALVGSNAYHRDPATGNWNLEQVLSGPPSEVELVGNRAVLAIGDQVAVFTRDPLTGVWSQGQTITNSTDVGSIAEVGSIAFDGRLLVIGLPDSNVTTAGRVRIYRLETDSTWTLIGQDSAFGTGFHAGRSVALQGDILVVGAPGSGQGGLANAGSVFVYRFIPSTASWLRVQTLRSPEPVADGAFGTEVTLDRGYLAVSASRADGADDGLVSIFRLDPNTNLFRLERAIGGPAQSAPFNGADLGRSLALEGNLLFVGMMTSARIGVRPVGSINCDGDAVSDSCELVLGQDFDTNANGLVDSCEEKGTRYCSPAAPNSTGEPGRMGLFNETRIAFFNMSLWADGLPPGAFGYFIGSRSNGVSRDPSAWNGSLCVDGSPISQRIGGVQFANNDGRAGVLIYNRPQVPGPSPGSLVPLFPGDTWYFQYTYMDPGASPQTSYTDAVSITFQLF